MIEQSKTLKILHLIFFLIQHRSITSIFIDMNSPKEYNAVIFKVISPFINKIESLKFIPLINVIKNLRL